MGIKSSWTACQVGSILWQSGACLEACIDKPCTLAVIPYLSWSLLFSNFVCCSFLVIFFSCLSEWWSEERKKPWEQQGCYFQSDLKDNCKANALKLTTKNTWMPLLVTTFSPDPSLSQFRLKACPDTTVEGMTGMRGILGHSHLGTVSSLNEKVAPWFTERGEPRHKWIKSHNSFNS